METNSSASILFITSAAISGFTIFAQTFTTIISIIIIPLFYFGIYKRSKTFDEIIPSSLKDAIIYNETEIDGIPYGFIFGKWFIGYIKETSENADSSYWIFSTKSTFEKITTDISSCSSEKSLNGSLFQERTLKINKNLFIVHITGNFSCRRINFTKCNPIDCEPKPEQSRIIDSILSLKKKNQVILISGPPGSGKSFIADLLIKELLVNPKTCFKNCEEVVYTYNFNPTIPNSYFSYIYLKTNPSEKKRLIVLIDEVDIILSKIFSGSITQNSKYPTEVYDKTTWNRFLDNFDRGYFPWVTLILTSNKPKRFIDDLDSSLLRNGRLDLYETL